MKGLYRVFYTEYERGFGQKQFQEPAFFTTEKEALDEVERFNAPNVENYERTKRTPDWYAVAMYTKVN